MMRPHVVPWDNVGSDEHESDPNDSLFDNRILAEGDSWFSMGGIKNIRHCEERSDAAISLVRCQRHEIAALRRALKDDATILRKYSWGAMTGV